MSIKINKFSIRLILSTLLVFACLPAALHAQDGGDHIADKPLFHDPVYDGAADPALIWNKNEKVADVLEKVGLKTKGFTTCT